MASELRAAAHNTSGPPSADRSARKADACVTRARAAPGRSVEEIAAELTLAGTRCPRKRSGRSLTRKGSSAWRACTSARGAPHGWPRSGRALSDWPADTSIGCDHAACSCSPRRSPSSDSPSSSRRVATSTTVLSAWHSIGSLLLHRVRTRAQVTCTRSLMTGLALLMGLTHSRKPRTWAATPTVRGVPPARRCWRA